MRISGDPESPHYVRPEACRGVVVFYNGMPIKGCVTVDEDLDWALCNVHDASGEIVVDRAAGRIAEREITSTFRVFIPQLRPEHGFDAWMRERTDAAHSAFLEHGARGGIAYN